MGREAGEATAACPEGRRGLSSAPKSDVGGSVWPKDADGVAVATSGGGGVRASGGGGTGAGVIMGGGGVGTPTSGGLGTAGPDAGPRGGSARPSVDPQDAQTAVPMALYQSQRPQTMPSSRSVVTRLAAGAYQMKVNLCGASLMPTALQSR